MLPNVLVIGAQKAATSWIYQCLKEHPEVFVPFVKEQHFFDRNYHEGLEWYERYFKGYRSEKGICEVSPSYLGSDVAPERIKRTLGDIKLIVCLRNPIERAFSQYKMNLRKKITNVAFEQLWKSQEGYEYFGYIPLGCYHTHLERYLKFFPKENILILIYEDIQNDPTGFIQRIYRFIGVDENFNPKSADKIIPPESLEYGSFYKFAKKLTSIIRKWGLSSLTEAIKKSKIQVLFDRIMIRSSHGERIGNKDQKDTKKMEMDPQTRIELREVFSDEIKKLSELIDRDLSFWK